MAAALLVIVVLYQVSQYTAVPAPGLLFSKFFPQTPTTAPTLPFAGILSSLAGVIPSASNLLTPGLSSGQTPGLGIPQAGQPSGTLPGQTTPQGGSSPGSSTPVFPIPGITMPLFPGLPGILSGQPSVPVSQGPGIFPGTPASVPGSTSGAGIPGIIPALAAPLLPGISAIISSLQTPIMPVTTASNGTTVPSTTQVSDQLKSQLDAAKITYIQNGLAYGIALAQQVIAGFFQGLLAPLSTPTSNIQSG